VYPQNSQKCSSKQKVQQEQQSNKQEESSNIFPTTTVLLIVSLILLPTVGATSIDIVTVNVGKNVLRCIDLILQLLSYKVGTILLQEIGINMGELQNLTHKPPPSHWRKRLTKYFKCKYPRKTNYNL